MTQYLLPCPSCQKSMPIEISQAGGELTCPLCGAAVSVPTMRKIRELPVVEEKQVTPKKSTSGNQSVLALSLAAIFLGIGLAGSFFYLSKQLVVSELTDEIIESVSADFEKMPLHDLSEKWRTIVRNRDLQLEQQANADTENKQTRFVYNSVAYFGAFMAILGSVGAVASQFMKNLRNE